uniref:Thioredoxin domain-containing protein n=2 Tax=Gopherus TaxID=38771 RepID=A0A8C4YT24_9SAUR
MNLSGKGKAGKVDCQAYAHTCQTAGIRAYPTVKFYLYQRAKVNITLNMIHTNHDLRTSMGQTQV